MENHETKRLRNAIANLAKLRGSECWDLGDKILRDVLDNLDAGQLKKILKKHSKDIALSLKKLSGNNATYLEIMDVADNGECADAARRQAEILSDLALAVWVMEDYEDVKESAPAPKPAPEASPAEKKAPEEEKPAPEPETPAGSGETEPAPEPAKTNPRPKLKIVPDAKENSAKKEGEKA